MNKGPAARAPKLGARNTKQRAAVIDALVALNNFASAKTIHHELTQRGTPVGLSTVYRTLQSLADVHAVDVLSVAGGESLYRHCLSEDHHHHLVCTECGSTKEIDGGPVEHWAKEVAAHYGFSLTGHDAEIYGLCPECCARQEQASNNAED
ncbi:MULTISPECIES: Fur family transcriptional regulator [unclassified Corynebacterium]|uniref:Fur family transcriptional regulator n=1 Tax=unclassified Corynebacterium TaxID=2624378 RepID=UPI0029C9B66F|nr:MULTISPECIES: Fur family transcriptional regulator [unclassified Corynebacterium]WPF65537.1 Fur family transcriptional regulator [Corynebacterium sp. 22KM0430]WPF68032.1 Fur family transcriptional regulator [Corynebacterium sp. 21KM1197]